MVLKKWDDGLTSDSGTFKFASSTGKISCSLAGPGTGKTFSLMRKVAYLLEVEKIDAKNILIITFTRAAAADLVKALSKLGVTEANEINARTLHSFCLGILLSRDVFETLGRFPRPMVEHEVKVMLKDINETNGDMNFGKLKHREKLLLAYEGAWARLQIDTPGFTQSEEEKEFMERILHWMNYHHSMLIGEIVPYTLQYLKYNPEDIIINEYTHILIDEYQDLNKAEQVIIDQISSGKNLSVVGDDNQSIYSFNVNIPKLVPLGSGDFHVFFSTNE